MAKKIMNTSLRVIFRIAFLIISLGLIYIAGTKSYEFVYEFMAETPSNNKVIKDVDISIPQGSKTNDIGKILEENGLIKNANIFTWQVKLLTDYDGKFRYGDFVLNTGMTEEEMMKILASEGQQKETIKFTIPEGYSVQQTARKLQSEGLCKESDFIDAINELKYDYRIFEYIPDRNLKLQGYLFPDTYQVYEDSSARDIASRMLSRFDDIFIDEYYNRADELGYTVDEIIIIASLIEKEAKRDDERQTIAGVIYNRLDEGMNLRIDASVQYIKTKGKYTNTRLYNADLEEDSPYNTYKYEGIPKGPISNPGAEAIYAALYPEEHQYLYYLLKDESTGEHVFNETYEDHLRDKNRYID